jgi:CCR4-NOT transcription complex subunit 9
LNRNISTLQYNLQLPDKLEKVARSQAARMMPHGMGGHAFSHQQDPFMSYNPQAHHAHAQASHPQPHGMQQYGRLAAAASNASSNPSLALGGGGAGGVDRLTGNSLAAAAGIGSMGGERALAATSAADGITSEFGGEDQRKTMEFIVQLLNAQTRETALLELSKKREAVPELALVLWHSFGTQLLSDIILYLCVLMCD